MADLLTVMRSQRACRRFDPHGEVPDADAEQMLQAAVHAPSAENSQPWAFVVVRDDQTRAELARWWTESWRAGGSEYAREHLHGDAVYRDLEFTVTPGGFAAAPVIVVVCANLERVMEVFAAASIYPAVQNLLLAANALGYGSCLTTGLTTFAVDRVRELLKLPEALSPLAAVYIGRPATRLRLPKRDPIASVTYRERFGTPW